MMLAADAVRLNVAWLGPVETHFESHLYKRTPSFTPFGVNTDFLLILHLACFFYVFCAVEL